MSVLSTDEQGDITQFVIKEIDRNVQKAKRLIKIHNFDLLLETFGLAKTEILVLRMYGHGSLEATTIIEILNSKEIVKNLNGSY